MAPHAVAPQHFGLAASPHLAAQLAGATIDVPALIAHGRATGAACEALVAEGVGGLLVPLGGGWSVRDTARELGLPVVVAARPGLGTINHSLLTLEAARAAGLDVRAVVFGPWPAQPSTMERSNLETVATLGAVEVATLPRLPGPDAAALAAAGSALPLDRWLGP
jgi:dethiobiotin synthetase